MYADHPRKFEQLATGLAGVLHRGTEKYAKPTKVGPSLLLAPLAEIGDRILVIIWTLGCCANALKILHGIKNSKDSTERHSQAKVSALGQNDELPKIKESIRASESAQHMVNGLVVTNSQSLEVAAAPVFAFSMNLMFSDVRCRAALRPETRPNTTQSSKEFPPRRLLPCTPPIASPAA